MLLLLLLLLDDGVICSVGNTPTCPSEQVPVVETKEGRERWWGLFTADDDWVVDVLRSCELALLLLLLSSSRKSHIISSP